MVGCLTDEMLSQLIRGMLPAAEMSRVQEHIDKCPDCWSLVTGALESGTAGKTDTPPATGAAAPPQGGADEGLKIGQVLGHYQVVRELGHGGMGFVYEAIQAQIKSRVAIKILQPRFTHNREVVARFLNEARAANSIGHPCIIQVHEMGQLESGATYIIMEHLEGRSLADDCKEVGPERWPASLRLCCQIASALAVAHERGVIHRDLKPSNVMVIPDPLLPGGERAKILDFGMAKLAELNLDSACTPLQTPSSAMLGTPAYMAPEQCGTAGSVDGQADVYALGVMLYQFLSGRLPFFSNSIGHLIAMKLRDEPSAIETLCPSLPQQLAALVHAMLARAPAARPTMAQVAVRLSALPPLHAAASPPPARSLWATAIPIAVLLGAGLYGMRGLLKRASSRLASRGAAQTMALIPAGTFLMGSSPEEIDGAFFWCQRLTGDPCVLEHFQREQPVREVHLSAFSLDTTEVTNERFVSWLNGRAGLTVRNERLVLDGKVLLVDLYPTYGQAGIAHSSAGFRVLRGYDRRPVTQVTWDAAQLYCNAQGKRLPTEAEWEYAARGARGHRFPWGDEEPECEGVVFARVRGRSCAHLGSGPQDVGTAAMDRSAQGVFDLAGNVAEWVMDRMEDRYPSCGPTCENPALDAERAHSGPEFRVLRGGDWYVSAALCRAAGRGRWQRDTTAGNIGFRCAASAHR